MVNDQQKSCLLGYSQADEALVHLPTPTTIVVENQAPIVLKNKHNTEERRVDGLYV